VSQSYALSMVQKVTLLLRKPSVRCWCFALCEYNDLQCMFGDIWTLKNTLFAKKNRYICLLNFRPYSGTNADHVRFQSRLSELKRPIPRTSAPSSGKTLATTRCISFHERYAQKRRNDFCIFIHSDLDLWPLVLKFAPPPYSVSGLYFSQIWNFS